MASNLPILHLLYYYCVYLRCPHKHAHFSVRVVRMSSFSSYQLLIQMATMLSSSLCNGYHTFPMTRLVLYLCVHHFALMGTAILVSGDTTVSVALLFHLVLQKHKSLALLSTVS